MHLDLEEFLHRTLDSPTIVEDLTWPDGNRPLVLKLIDRSGQQWFLKRHTVDDTYRAEVTAYERWTPSLRGRAPDLHAADERLLALIITALPGTTPGDWQRPELMDQAGRLLHRFHESETCPQDHDTISEKLAELDQARSQAPDLLDDHILDFARAQLDGLRGITSPRRVPCHRDYSPRNWLIHDERMYLIDFGDSGMDAWINDFGRLFIGWRLGGDLKAALVRGYGCEPTAEDLAVLHASYTARLVSHVVFAHEHGYAQAEAACRQVLDELISGEIA